MGVLLRLPLAVFIMLALQVSGEQELEQARLALKDGTRDSLFTVVASYEDGSPVNKGEISCSGYWFKQADETEDEVPTWAPWFQMDSRGAVIFLDRRTEDDEGQPFWYTCNARKDGKTGTVGFSAPKSTLVVEVTIK